MKTAIGRRTYVDVHVIQTVPPSNLNRDDAGSPKQAIYGGVRRARVSSQAWKRATRMYIAASQPPENAATRTKRLADLVSEALVSRSGIAREQADRIGLALIASGKWKMDTERSRHTAYLLFFGNAQVQRLVDQVADRATGLAALAEKDLPAAVSDVDVASILGEGHPLEVRLFGRMVADLAHLNVEAATQVAHAISTHAVDIEFDYYTAVDDKNPSDETGAGMIGTVEFNSATLYRYATVAAHQLFDGMARADAISACTAFVEAFAKSIPSGHEHSFAHHTRPGLVLIVVRDDQPVNLVTAFESPVRPDQGLEAASIVRLAHELASSASAWGDKPRAIAATYRPDAAENPAVTAAFGPSLTFDQLLTRVRSSLLAGAAETPA